MSEYYHSPIPSTDSLRTMEETQTGFTLSDVSSLPSVSSGSEQSIDKLSETEADKKLRHVGYLIDEMTDTELTYISALSDVTEGYISKIRCGENTGFTDEMILEVFVNIEDIRRFHIDLHRDLVDCQRDHRRVAQLFISKTNVITEMYVDFCSAFPRSLEKLEELHDTEPSKSFLVRCQADLNHIFGVEEYLHRAIQRVLKYPLLFRDMSKKLRDQDGCDVVDEALSKVLVTAVKINAVKRVQELQSNELVGWTGGDMALMGDLLLEDTFKLVGAKDPRYLFLFKKCLLLTKKRENEGTFVLKNKVDMDNITLKEQVDGDFLKWSIFVGKGTESYTLQARDDDEKGAWTREVKRCIVYSTPGLSEDQKEDLLLKLPSLKNDCEQIARLWKRGTKKTKTKGAKQNSDVQIIHNSDKVKDSVLSGWAPSDSYTTDPSTIPLSRLGKRKLIKKKSSQVKISHPVGFISDSFNHHEKKANLVDLRNKYHKSASNSPPMTVKEKKHMSCPEMSDVYHTDRASPLSLPDEQLTNRSVELGTPDSTEFITPDSMDISTPDSISTISQNICSDYDSPLDSVAPFLGPVTFVSTDQVDNTTHMKFTATSGSQANSMLSLTPEVFDKHPSPVSSPSLAEILDYDVVKEKVNNDNMNCKMELELPKTGQSDDLLTNIDRKMLGGEGPDGYNSDDDDVNDLSPSIDILSDKDYSPQPNSNVLHINCDQIICQKDDIIVDFNTNKNDNIESVSLVEIDGTKLYDIESGGIRSISESSHNKVYSNNEQITDNLGELNLQSSKCLEYDENMSEQKSTSINHEKIPDLDYVVKTETFIQPVPISNQQAASHELVSQLQEPVTQQQELVSQEKEPVTQQQELVSQEKEPVTQQQKPVCQKQEPVTQQQEPVTQQQEPVCQQQEPITQQHKTVSEQQEPVSQQQEPVTHQQEPVTQQQEPVTQQQEPVCQQQEPVSQQQKPVSEQQEPVCQKQEPVTQQQEPVTQKQEPVTQLQEPITQQQELVFQHEKLSLSQPLYTEPELSKESRAPQRLVKDEKPVSLVKPVQQVAPLCRRESETTSTTETEDFHIKNSGFKNRRTAVKIRAPLEDISDLTYKSDITSSTEQLDSDLDNLQSDKEVPQLDTGADTVLSYVVNCSLNSRFYPQVLLFLIYLVACVFYFLPWYITYPTVIGTVSYSVYRRTCDNQTNM